MQSIKKGPIGKREKTNRPLSVGYLILAILDNTTFPKKCKKKIHFSCFFTVLRNFTEKCPSENEGGKKIFIFLSFYCCFPLFLLTLRIMLERCISFTEISSRMVYIQGMTISVSTVANISPQHIASAMGTKNGSFPPMP